MFKDDYKLLVVGLILLVVAVGLMVHGLNVLSAGVDSYISCRADGITNYECLDR